MNPYSQPLVDLAESSIEIIEHLHIIGVHVQAPRYIDRLEWFAEDKENFITFNLFEKKWYHKERWSYRMIGEPRRMGFNAMFGFMRFYDIINFESMARYKPRSVDEVIAEREKNYRYEIKQVDLNTHPGAN